MNINNLVDISIIINGAVVPLYEHENDTYLEGRIGSEYVIRARNKTGKRILLVPSVDGLSVIDGKRATHKSGGFIIDPYSTYDLTGFLVDDKTAAKFTFSDIKSSYASKTGNDENNVGVIGFAVYKEELPKILHRIPQEWQQQIHRNWTSICNSVASPNCVPTVPIDCTVG